MSRAITLSAMLLGLLTLDGVSAICRGQELPSPPKAGTKLDPPNDDGKLTAQTPIRLPVAATARGENIANSPTGPQSPARQEVPPGADAKNACPAGLVIDSEGKTLWAALNLRNSLAQIDLTSSEV